MTVSHTLWGDAAIWVEAVTRLMPAFLSSRGEGLESFPLPQRMFDRGIKRVQWHLEPHGRVFAADEQVAAEAAHQRQHELGLLACDRGSHARRERRQADAQPQRGAAYEHQ